MSKTDVLYHPELKTRGVWYFQPQVRGRMTDEEAMAALRDLVSADGLDPENLTEWKTFAWKPMDVSNPTEPGSDVVDLRLHYAFCVVPEEQR